MTLFDLENKKSRILELEKQQEDENFWNNPDEAVKVVNEINELKEKVTVFDSLAKKVEDLQDFSSSIDQSQLDLLELFDEELTELEKEVDAFRKEILFSEEYDSLNAILDIHPGAGGVEAHDWASMLYRMYIRFAELHHLKVEVLDYLPGEEAGISSATLRIKGKHAYGLLKSEKGVHRLVRISPFNAQGKRQTSFASVGVVPEFTDKIDIKIDEKDLKVDTYRSSGAGGQNVNKVSSAVRITHLPTGIVVSCQVDRSQLNNKETCMQMLKSKLYERELEAKANKLKGIIGEQKENEWGSQIRSYVFCPYTLVKDARTSYETNDVQAVMDGDIDGFIYSYLEMEAKTNESIQ